MSVALIESAATALGPEFLEDVAFLGAASIPLWITEPGAPPARATQDVDVIVEVGSLIGYYAIGERLKGHGFEEDSDAPEICAWKHLGSNLLLDVMPTEAEILGFTNRWYAEALAAAVPLQLPSGVTIRAVPPPYLIATKIEAFKGRGRDADGQPDYLGSRDFGDVVFLVDGRAELVDEVLQSPRSLREYLADELQRLQRDARFEGGVAGHLLPDLASQARRELVLERIRRLSGRSSEAVEG